MPTAAEDADPAQVIVSFAKNFIFLKTRKTGGITVEIALTPSCGTAAPSTRSMAPVAVDQILRLQAFEDDLKAVTDRLGLSLPAALPRAKGGFRTERRPAREILSDR